MLDIKIVDETIKKLDPKNCYVGDYNGVKCTHNWPAYPLKCSICKTDQYVVVRGHRGCPNYGCLKCGHIWWSSI